MTFLKYIALLLCATVALFVLHVPLMATISKPRGEYASYPSITAPIETDSFEMVQLLDDRVFNVWYDTESNNFIVFGETDGGRFFITLDRQGQILKTVKNNFNDDIPYDNNPRYTVVNQLPERKYVPEYDFAALSGIVEMMHFQYEKFEWPYMYYMIPVITFNWEGRAFINIHHNSETFAFQIPTDYFSQASYFQGSFDGQIYAYPPIESAPKIAFISIEESSYTSLSHRDGLGFYVLRPK